MGQDWAYSCSGLLGSPLAGHLAQAGASTSGWAGSGAGVAAVASGAAGASSAAGGEDVTTCRTGEAVPASAGRRSQFAFLQGGLGFHVALV